MDIATQLNGNDLILFVEGTSWKKVTAPFNQEKAKVELAVFMSNGLDVFYDANLNSATNSPTFSAFCKETITVGEFKRRLKKDGFGEPYEVKLSGERFGIKKEFSGAFTIVFRQYENNPLLSDWLLKIFPVLETAKLIRCLKSGKRYYTKNFSLYGEFENLETFTGHRFEIWHNAIVKEYEDALSKGKANCDGCNI